MTKLDQPSNQAIDAVNFEAPSGVIEQPRFKLTKGHWGLLLVGIACLLFMAFISLARSIQITAVTPDLENPKLMVPLVAEVKIASWLKLPIGNRVLVLPGRHEIVAVADGFLAREQTLEVAKDRHQSFALELARLPGQLAISIEPNVDAAVIIDGERVTTLSAKDAQPVQDIPAGRREITIDAELYRPASQSVVVQGKGVTQPLSFTLEPAWGTLQVGSEPAGATIKIDGREVGKTPFQLKVEEGLHTLTLEAEKFKPFNQDFTIFAQQDLQVPNVMLIPADGTLKVETTPTAAAVILNGEYYGASPLTLKVKPNQAQRLQVYRAGYRLHDQEVTLAPAQEQAADIPLQQDSVAVRFSVSPQDATLYVDGVRRGTGSQTLSLNTLPHKIKVSKPGYVDYQNTVIPTKSSTQVVSIKLLTKEQHFWANVPSRYNTSEGQEMVLFKSPGEVQLGSSRRETGRRANETRYKARLKAHFYASRHEVTNKQFRRFKPTHNSGNYKRRSLDSAKHPVVNVSWQDAARYCNWLSLREGLDPFYTTKAGFIAGLNQGANGYRLLTEVEWAWLARNKDGTVLTYPWQNPADLSGQPIGNFADKNAADIIAFTLPDYDDGYKASAPVGRYAANHRGLFDLDGNVAEWVNDWYSANSDLAGTNKLVDPLGPDEGEFHVIRGASWARGHLPQLRLAYRDFGAKGVHDVGFRIARYVGQPK